MQKYLDDALVRGALWLAAYSVVVWVVAIALGHASAPDALPDGIDYLTYFAAINWWPFPFFFLCMIPVLYLTWGSFLSAWRDLARTGVLVGADDQRVPPGSVEAVVASIGRRRWWALVPALAATLAVNGLDLQEDMRVYFGDAKRTEQVDYACAEPSAWTIWILAAEGVTCVADGAEAGEGAQTQSAPQTSDERLEPPADAIAFALMTWFQQAAIVFVVATGMAQLILHSCLFAGFERLVPAAQKHGLRLRLNAASPVNEFGLERWNYALNNFYWAACPALLAVYLSRLATTPENYRPGQEMLGWIVPTLLLVPMVLTILTRQARLPAVWIALETGSAGAATHETYARQQLWPLDRNWSSKLGIILAFILAALALGHEMNRLLILT